MEGLGLLGPAAPGNLLLGSVGFWPAAAYATKGHDAACQGGGGGGFGLGAWAPQVGSGFVPGYPVPYAVEVDDGHLRYGHPSMALLQAGIAPACGELPPAAAAAYHPPGMHPQQQQQQPSLYAPLMHHPAQDAGPEAWLWRPPCHPDCQCTHCQLRQGTLSPLLMAPPAPASAGVMLPLAPPAPRGLSLVPSPAPLHAAGFDLDPQTPPALRVAGLDAPLAAVPPPPPQHPAVAGIRAAADRRADAPPPAHAAETGADRQALQLPPGLASAGGATAGASPDAASVGSALHGTGECMPCAWFWKAQGCQNGRECRRCHLCPADEIKNRKRTKLAVLRQAPIATPGGAAETASAASGARAGDAWAEEGDGASSTTAPSTPAAAALDAGAAAALERAGPLALAMMAGAAADCGAAGTAAEPPRPAAASQGSDMHGSGKCCPCAWFWKPQGCQNGRACGRCHLCPPGEVKRRKAAKRAALSQHSHQQQEQSPDEEEECAPRGQTQQCAYVGRGGLLAGGCTAALGGA